MKTAAIICEYNPLHNGHLYHIQETRKSGITHLIALLSDDFVQRGDAALLNKFDRAKLALQAGADLVLELPVPFSCASAELYAGNAVKLLHDLHVVDFLSFGCSGNLNDLQELAQIPPDASRVQNFLKDGYSYPAAVFRAVSDSCRPEIVNLLTDANNLLALEYLKAMQNLHVRFCPLAVQRNAVPHDSTQTSGTFASASLIRERFFHQQEYETYLPDFTAQLLSECRDRGETADFSRLESVILYKMRMISEADLLSLPDMNPNLASRFLKAKYACSLPELLHSVKSKCFTMARIRRILLYALLDIRKEDFQQTIPYARVLAFNQKSTELLKLIKEKSAVPVGTSLAKLRNTSPQAERFAQLQMYSAGLYGLAQNQIHSAEQEFRVKISLTK